MQISRNNNIGFSSSKIKLPVKRLEKTLNTALIEIKKADTPEEKILKKLIAIKKVNSLFSAFRRLISATETKSEKVMLTDAFHEFSGYNTALDSTFRNQYHIWEKYHKEHPELVNPFTHNKVGFDKTCELFFKSSVECMKRYQIFLDKDLASKKIPPLDIFNMAMDSVQEILKAKNISLNVKNLHLLEQNKPPYYDYKTYAVFSNLLGNAAKYTPENGKIEVDFFHKARKNGNFLMLSVKDTGIGIPPEEFEEAIYGLRASNAIESGIAGSGLGLNRVRKVCELLYRDPIEIKSPLYPAEKENKGTEIICPLVLLK